MITHQEMYNTSENAVRDHIWVAVSACDLVAIVRKPQALDISRYKLLRVVSVTLFGKMSISIAASGVGSTLDDTGTCNQWHLFDL